MLQLKCFRKTSNKVVFAYTCSGRPKIFAKQVLNRIIWVKTATVVLWRN